MIAANDLHVRLGQAAAIAAANELGIIASLLAARATPAEHAQTLGLDARATERVLDILVTTGFAARDGDVVTASDALRSLQQMPGVQELSLKLWTHTQRFVASGTPYIASDASNEAREHCYVGVVDHLADLYEDNARALARRLSAERRARRVLDVGCGSGVWGLALAECAADVEVVGLDLPAVTGSFLARAERLGITRASTIPGDAHTITLPDAAFDLIMVANVLRVWPAEQAARMLAKLARALTADGRIVVVDALAAETEKDDAERAVYALHLSLRTERGRVHSAAEIRAWLSAAGLSEIAALPIGWAPGAISALVAAPKRSAARTS